MELKIKDKNYEYILNNDTTKKLIISEKNENNEIRIIEFILSFDIDFHLYCYNFNDKNEEVFSFDSTSALYPSFLRLMDNKEILIIEDDYSETDKKYIKFIKEIDQIKIIFHDEENKVSKYSYVIMNALFDLRSKCDQNNSDTKERLRNFFVSLDDNFYQKQKRFMI